MLSPRRFLKGIRRVTTSMRDTLMEPLDLRRSVLVLRRVEHELGLEHAWQVPSHFKGYGRYASIAAKQVSSEISTLYEIVLQLRPKYVLEIGTYRGGTFYMWCRAAAADATLVSIDLPEGLDGAYSRERIEFYKYFGQANQRLYFLARDSHAPATVNEVKNLLNAQLDLLFIDGDHSYAGVRADFINFSSFVRSGGLVAFHDILPRHGAPEIQVYRLWDEIKAEYQYQEIVAMNERTVGIGLIWMT